MTSNQSKEIIWNVVNSVLAGALVLLGECADGQITKAGFMIAIVAGAIVALSQFKDYWQKEKREYETKLFSFVKF